MKKSLSTLHSHLLGAVAGAMLFTGAGVSAETVAHYRFENGTDGAAALVAVDSSGNGYDLTAVDGTPLFSADVPVSEVTLTEEANDLSIDFGREQNALLGTVGEGLSAVEFGDITVETWVNFRNPTGWQTMVSRIDSAGDGHNNRPQALFILLNSGIDNRFWAELTTLENQTLQIEGGPVVVPGKWYHVAAVGDTTEGTLRLYVNGEEVASTTGYTGMLQPAMKMPWSIGRTTYAGNTSDWMNGKVDEVRISNVALAPSQFLNEFTFRTHPEDAVARTGENVTFVAEFVSKAPVAPDLQWEVSTDNGVTWNAISGANAESYTIVAASVGLDRNQYRLSATRDDLTVVSEAAVLRVGDTPVAVPANVVAHYRFEEGENPGDPAMGAQDSSGNENHLVNMAGSPFFSDLVPADPIVQTGETNRRSLDVTAAVSAIEGATDDSLSRVVWDDFTVETWVRFTDLGGWQQIIGRDDVGNQNEDIHSLFRMDKTDQNTLRVVAYGRQKQPLFLDTSHVFGLEVWTHVAVVGNKTEGTLSAFVDGKRVGSMSGFDGLMAPEPASAWTIGRGQWGDGKADWVTGQIDEVRFSSAALSPAEFLNFSNAVLRFVSHPENVTVPAGSSATFRALAGGGAGELTYQWQVLAAGEETWTDIAGATGADYSIGITHFDQNGNRYRLLASRGGVTEISEPAILTVLDVVFEIVRQPADLIVWAGLPATFSPEVVSSIPATFQWEVSTDGGETWNSVNGATDRVFTIPEASMESDGNQYRLIVTGGGEYTLTSESARLRVGDPNWSSTPASVVAHFRFEEGGAGAAVATGVDSSGNGHNLVTRRGAPVYSADVPGSGLSQTGEPNHFSLDLGISQNAIEGVDGDSLSHVDWDDFTIEAWVNFNSVEGWQQIVSRDDRHRQNNDDHSLFRVDNDPINSGLRVVATGRDGELIFLHTTHIFSPGVWTHVAIVGDLETRTMRAYANGRLVGSVGNYHGLFVPQFKTLWTIGRGQHFGTEFDWLNGKIDEVRFSSAALKPTEFLNFTHAILNFAIHPEDATVAAGESVSFNALAGGGGLGPVSYQWQVSDDDGETWADIPGAIGETYSVNKVRISQNRNRYRAIASRGGISEISDEAELQVNAYPAPRFVRDLGAGQLAFAGQEFALSVEATGAGNLTYQWKFAGEDLEGETGPVLNLGVVDASMAGLYSVAVTDHGAAAEGGEPTTATVSTVLKVAASPAGSIGLNFPGTADGLRGFSIEFAQLGPREVAGLAPAAHWNNAPGQRAAESEPMPLTNDLGETVSAVAVWNANNTWAAREGTGSVASKLGSQKLYHGYIEARSGSSVTISEIPYSTYDVYVYPVGVDGAPGAFIRRIEVDDGSGARVFYGRSFGADNTVLPIPFQVATATTQEEAAATGTATVFHYAGLTGSSVTVTHQDAGGNNLGGIAAIQIVDTSAGTPARPVFVSRPAGKFLPAGGTATLSVEAKSVSLGTLSYQWSLSKDRGQTWTEVSGATDATLTIDADSSAKSGLYKVVVTDASGAGESVNVAYAPVAIVDGANPVLISADINRGTAAEMSGHGSLRIDGTISTSEIGAGDTRWTRLAEPHPEPVYTEFMDAEGLELPGLSFQVTGANGSHDSPLGGGMEPPVEGFSAPLLRDYVYTVNDRKMTAKLSGLKAFVGREVKLVVYAVGRDSTFWPMANFDGNGPQNDVSTVTLAARNSPTGVAQSGVTNQEEGRDIEFNPEAYVVFDGIVAPDGTLVWEIGPVLGEPGLNAFNGFQLLVTDQGDGPVYTAIELWRDLYFGTPENEGDAALDADPDGDGLSNLLEYALGTNPTEAGDGSAAVTSGLAGQFLTLTFSHIDDETLVYKIEAAGDLGDWTAAHIYPAFTEAGEKTYTDTAPISGSARRFLRLNVTLQE